jgi:hypothetical protein
MNPPGNNRRLVCRPPLSVNVANKVQTLLTTHRRRLFLRYVKRSRSHPPRKKLIHHGAEHVGPAKVKETRARRRGRGAKGECRPPSLARADIARSRPGSMRLDTREGPDALRQFPVQGGLVLAGCKMKDIGGGGETCGVLTACPAECRMCTLQDASIRNASLE